jgi:hypothetical protein
MKKIISLVAVLCFISSMAYADSLAYTNPNAKGNSADIAVAGPGSGNDGAIAFGGSGGGAQNFGTANLTGFGKTFAIGTANAVGTTGAVAGVKDTGNTSMSGAAIGTVVNVNAGGLSGYLGYGHEAGATNLSEGYVKGNVFQANTANETGYAGGDKAEAGNFSGASFSGYAVDGNASSIDYGHKLNGQPKQGLLIDGAGSGISMTGMAGTAGGSIANVQPNHSAFAATGNISGAAVIGADIKDTNVYGVGCVETFVNKGNAFNGAAAGGSSGFGYSGNTLGAGGAVMNSTVHQNGSSFSSNSSGASFSAVK